MRNHRDVAHRWAHKIGDSAKGGNVYFSDDVIYSYGPHFPVARHTTDTHGKACVLFTTRSYSVTTAKHKSQIRSAIPSDVPVYHVHYVTARPRMASLDEYAARIDAALVKASKATKHADWYLREASEQISEANAFSVAFKLRRRFTMPGNLNEIREHVKKQAVAHRKAEARKLVQLTAERSKRLSEWAGVKLTWKQGFNYMRIAADGVSIETDNRAMVPLADVQAIAPMIVSMFANGQTYKRNGERITVGDYVIDEITTTTLRVGCHLFDRAECERIAALVREANHATENAS